MLAVLALVLVRALWTLWGGRVATFVAVEAEAALAPLLLGGMLHYCGVVGAIVTQFFSLSLDKTCFDWAEGLLGRTGMADQVCGVGGVENRARVECERTRM